MKHLKTYESFDENSEFLLDIKDILVELEDDGFKVDYLFDTRCQIIHIFIDKPGYLFKMNDNLIYILKRMSRFLGKSIEGFWRFGTESERKFYIHSDNRGIRTDLLKMDKNWPTISAMRLLIWY